MIYFEYNTNAVWHLLCWLVRKIWATEDEDTSSSFFIFLKCILHTYNYIFIIKSSTINLYSVAYTHIIYKYIVVIFINTLPSLD